MASWRSSPVVAMEWAMATPSKARWVTDGAPPGVPAPRLATTPGGTRWSPAGGNGVPAPSAAAAARVLANVWVRSSRATRRPVIWLSRRICHLAMKMVALGVAEMGADEDELDIHGSAADGGGGCPRRRCGYAESPARPSPATNTKRPSRYVSPTRPFLFNLRLPAHRGIGTVAPSRGTESIHLGHHHYHPSVEILAPSCCFLLLLAILSPERIIQHGEEALELYPFLNIASPTRGSCGWSREGAPARQLDNRCSWRKHLSVDHEQEQQKENFSSPPKTSALLPRNTVTLYLEGNEEEFVENFRLCQAHYRFWLLCNSRFRIRYGRRMLYTTPIKGTFYYVLRYQGRYVVLVIDARTGWLVGFFNGKGIYEFECSDYVGSYMNSSQCKKLQFKGSHGEISPEGTENTRLNLHFFRKCFHHLSSYEATNRRDPVGFRSSVGVMVVMILESKFKMVHQKICHAMENAIESRLGDRFEWVKDLIINWSSISQQVMLALDNEKYNPHNCGIKEMQTLNDLLEVSHYLHVDGYCYGMFKHEALPPPPRDLVWSPVALGDGEEDIPLPREPRPMPGGAVRGRGLQMTKNKGLSGGQLGGAPAAPECFLKWSLTENDQDKTIDELISYLRDKLGLDFYKTCRPTSDCANRLVDHHPPLAEHPDQSQQAQIDSVSVDQEPEDHIGSDAKTQLEVENKKSIQNLPTCIEVEQLHCFGNCTVLAEQEQQSSQTNTIIKASTFQRLEEHDAVQSTETDIRNTYASALLTEDELMSLQLPDKFISHRTESEEVPVEIIVSGSAVSTTSIHGKEVYTDYSVTRISRDGRCLFRSVIHGACIRAGEPTPNEDHERKLADELRAMVADEFVKRKEESEWFIEGDFNTYVSHIRQQHVWGGEPELLMASHVLQMPITVYMKDGNAIGLIAIVEYGQQYVKKDPIQILYDGFGHYDVVCVPGKKC